MTQVQAYIGGEALDITRYADVLDIYGREEIIEMLEDISIAFAIHRFDRSGNEGISPGPDDSERLTFLHHLIGAVRAVKPL